MTLSTNNNKVLLSMHEIIHELYHYGRVSIHSNSKVDSTQVRDMLDLLGIKYETHSKLWLDMYPYTFIKLV
ncbi:hypothetical protein BCPG3_102 [Bacillus phage BCPG3]|uniref:Uncharacterized protein n=2 Tax=Wphvirus TaxID=1922327 RepID=W5QUP3_9CAUD|nr:hypothetical protein BPS13_0103 [Bacillus phage BPS13]YP_009002988.1 hypothetical protein BPS10C_102 [Bacillus phage BPS10C]QQO38893.1 hypothetical protein BCPG1_162 [Bacillus phage BCPG1]QSJ04419.1 hypothetical protein BCPG3_102 [Bacillus phage BCPG3]AEZ50282.1 hypothetical protein BPS13_0103 [Bacillus phage BPS13]AGI12099.1 hypothetical protein BPS10C_102 [Bacillus phage BPS10C]